MKVTFFLTGLAGAQAVAAYEYVYLVNSVKGNEVSSGMAYYGDKNPPGNMVRPSDYTDVTHGTFTYWEGKAVKGKFRSGDVPTSDLAPYFFWVSKLQYVLLLHRSMGYTKVTAQWMIVPVWITGAVCQLARSWKRSIAISIVNSFGHLAIIFGSYLWPSTNDPQHLVGFATLTATCGLGCVIAIAAPGYLNLQPQEPITEAKQEREALQQQDQQRQESWGPQ
ncbi:allantoate permease [Fusarium subglutinans]|uniref:Allantoate permease n=1 Tax=Gibberella subglutinans TaxID=42677 RepID=A0A8H5PUN7_GIBSU|nr:allantoate permease [Fusarium subglutinans]KAF5603835.1 allantoate permease [Fusarium subglutinans]